MIDIDQLVEWLESHTDNPREMILAIIGQMDSELLAEFHRVVAALSQAIELNRKTLEQQFLAYAKIAAEPIDAVEPVPAESQSDDEFHDWIR